MGKMVSFTNTGKGIRHIGNKTLGPNDTREVDVDHLEGDERKKYLGEEPVNTAPAAPSILVLLDQNIARLAAALALKNEAGEFVVSKDQLLELQDGEKAVKNPRKGALEAIAAELLNRADAGVETKTDEFVATLNEMELQELHDQFELHKDDAGSLAIVENVWREKLSTMDAAGLTSIVETLVEDSRQLEILNEVIETAE